MARASAALVQSRGDRVGRTVDFRLSTGRDVAAAKAFFRKAIDSPRRAPQTITLDGIVTATRSGRFGWRQTRLTA